MVSETGAVDKTGSVGSFLRKSRESQGISLDEAARVTRISPMYLTALENERFDILPNPAYAKGFLRAYAAFLGLSGDEVVGLFEGGGAPAPEATPLPAEKAPSRIGTNAGTHRRRRLAVSMLLLALVLAAAYLFGEKKVPSERHAAIPPVPAPAPPAPVQHPISSPAPPATPPPEPPAAPADRHAAETVPPRDGQQPTGIVLRLRITRDNSLNITIDGMISQQYDLRPGDLIEWKADRVIVLDMGDAGGVEAELNGRPMKPFGEQGKSAHVVVTASTPPS